MDNKVSHPFMQPQDVNFHGQEQVYGDLGEEMLEHAFEGKSQMKKKWLDDVKELFFRYCKSPPTKRGSRSTGCLDKFGIC